jgi:hypothetical protein
MGQHAQPVGRRFEFMICLLEVGWFEWSLVIARLPIRVVDSTLN